MLKYLKESASRIKRDDLFDGPLQRRKAKYEIELVKYGLGMQPAYCMCTEEAWEDFALPSQWSEDNNLAGGK